LFSARFTVRPFRAKAVPDLAERPGKEKQITGSTTKQAGAPRWNAVRRWTLGVTSIAAFMAGMDALVVTTAIQQHTTAQVR
jgi:hypothetical protein